MEPIARKHNYTEWMVLFFFVLVFVLVLVWYYFPERMIKLIYSDDSKKVKKLGNSQFYNPGLALYLLITAVFISSSTVIAYFISKQYFNLNHFDGYDVPHVLLFLSIALIIYYLIRFLILFFSGIIFNTVAINRNLLKSFLRIDVIQGLLFVPLVFLIYFTKTGFWINVSLVLLGLIIFYKWYKLFLAGLNISNVFVFHIILYLCSLEIIPVFVMIRVLDWIQNTGWL
jgi:hypothetical protein